MADLAEGGRGAHARLREAGARDEDWSPLRKMARSEIVLEPGAEGEF